MQKIFYTKISRVLVFDGLGFCFYPFLHVGYSTELEERPPFVNTSMALPGPAFPSVYDLSPDYDASMQMAQGRVYPPIFRPTPRFFTPLCVSSNTVFDPVSGESFAYQRQSVPLLKETEES